MKAPLIIPMVIIGWFYPLSVFKGDLESLPGHISCLRHRLGEQALPGLAWACFCEGRRPRPGLNPTCPQSLPICHLCLLPDTAPIGRGRQSSPETRLTVSNAFSFLLPFSVMRPKQLPYSTYLQLSKVSSHLPHTWVLGTRLRHRHRSSSVPYSSAAERARSKSPVPKEKQANIHTYIQKEEE